MNEPEEWRAVLGFEERYEVSSLGRVRRVSCVTKGGRGAPWTRVQPMRERRVVVGSQGYLKVTFLINGMGTNKNLHILILEAFVGPRPAGMFGCHNDGNRLNNSISNLRWGTPSSNSLDKNLHGTMANGEKNGNSKLCAGDVDRIRDLGAFKIVHREIAKWMGAHKSTVSRIVKKESWAHV